MRSEDRAAVERALTELFGDIVASTLDLLVEFDSGVRLGRLAHDAGLPGD